VGTLLMGFSSIGNGLGLLLHWQTARKMRYRQRVVRPNCSKTDEHLKQLLWWIAPSMTVSIVLGLAASGFASIHHTGLGVEAEMMISAVFIAGYFLLSLPHLATSLIMQADFESLSHELARAVRASHQDDRVRRASRGSGPCSRSAGAVDDVDFDRLEQVQNTIARTEQAWRTFLRWHFIFEGSALVANFIAESFFLTFDALDRANIWWSVSFGHFANHPILTMSFLVLQVVALANYNQEVSRLQEETPSNTVYRRLGQRMNKLQISVFWVTITKLKLKTMMGSVFLSSIRTFLKLALSWGDIPHDLPGPQRHKHAFLLRVVDSSNQRMV